MLNFKFQTLAPQSNCRLKPVDALGKIFRFKVSQQLLAIFVLINLYQHDYTTPVMSGSLNPQYIDIGKGFVTQYYALFDDPNQRNSLVNMYNTELSFMTFEGQQIQGSAKILEKLQSLSFQKINRIITAVDSQPMFDGGVLINVLGRLQTDDDSPHAYTQTFVLKPLGGSLFLQHDIFRLALHDQA